MRTRRGQQTLHSSPTSPPIYQSSVYTMKTMAEVEAAFGGEAGYYIYGRNGSPNAQALAEALTEWEAAEDAVVAGSGMGAISMTLLALLKPGDRVVAVGSIYGGTDALLRNDLNRFDISTTFVGPADRAALERTAPGARVVYVETISNPLMDVADIPDLARIAHEAGALLVVDNTFASPVLAKPLKLGADIVVESMTKYINGHSDAMGGLAAGSKELVAPIRQTVVHFGPVLAPFEAWLMERSLESLELRVARQSENALAIARMLGSHRRVKQVFYPGLEQHPQHELARAMLDGRFGGMLSFSLDANQEQMGTFLEALRVVQFVPSLAGTHTTVSHPATTSHRALPVAERERMGIGYNLVRLSAGIDPVEDVLKDLEHALTVM